MSATEGSKKTTRFLTGASIRIKLSLTERIHGVLKLNLVDIKLPGPKILPTENNSKYMSACYLF